MGGPGGGFGMMGGFGGMMGGQGAPVSKEDITKIAKMINLTGDQQTAAQALLDGHLATYTQKADEFRKQMEDVREEFRETRDFAVWQDFAPKADAFRKYRTEVETKIMDDIKSILEPKQAEKWPAVERARRRDASMGRGFVSGERADLVKIVDDLKLEPAKRSELDVTLEQYEIELDRELVKRNKMQEEGMAKAQELMRGGDMTQMQDLMNQGREASIKVRDVNRKYAKQIASALTGDAAAKFEAEYKKLSFPQIYRERYTDKVLAAAVAMKDLDQSQRDGIMAINESYTRENKTLNERAEKAMEENEANFKVEDMMRGGFGGGAAMEELRTARTDLEKATIDKIKGVLTPEQAAKLPERDQGRGDRGNGGGNGDAPRPRRNRNNGGNDAPPADRTPPAAPGK